MISDVLIKNLLVPTSFDESDRLSVFILGVVFSPPDIIRSFTFYF